MAVHVDHLDRPVAMTDAAGTTVWRAFYKPFGEVQSVTGPASLDARFPGQWFMAEAGLAYNWHRWYDASLGRYTQPDPLGLVDGPSRYAYARNSPLVYVDPDGRLPRGGVGFGGISPSWARSCGQSDEIPYDGDSFTQPASWRDKAIALYCFICWTRPPKPIEVPPPRPRPVIENPREPPRK